MDQRVISIVTDYILGGCPKDEAHVKFDIYIVWKCKILKNWKYLISTTIEDGMYYELTYNGEKDEWYLDAYMKIENRVVKDVL